MATGNHKKGFPVEDLGRFKFPPEVVSVLQQRGITELNPIQVTALESGLLTGTNLIVVAPTSSGKTLVAELAAVHHGINSKGAFYLVSLKALAEEKYDLFKRFWTVGNEPILRTAITTGDRDFEDDNLSQCKITFATYEKLFALIRDNPSLLDHVSLIVVDEIQTLGDKSRGFVLETLLTIIRMRKPNIQIIGLSAAIPNPEDTALWLNAKVCTTPARDIPLLEEVWSTSRIHSKLFGTGYDSLKERENPTGSADTLTIIRHHIAIGRKPIVVFCMTKPRAEDLARAHYALTRKEDLSSRLKRALDEVKQLLLFWSEGGPTGKSLMAVVDAGIAFHHADLTQDERRIIEDKLRDGTIEVVYATTTLGQGVNLPVAVVIFDDVYRGWIESYIDKREYLNMSGRAGRRGLRDEGGTAILISRSARDRKMINAYLSEEAEQVESTLESTPLDSVILSLIASENASTVADIRAFLTSSLFGCKNLESNPALLDRYLSEVPEVVRSLEQEGLVFAAEKQKYRATEFGRITAQKGVPPRAAKELKDCLGRLKERVAVKREQAIALSEDLVPAVIHLFLESNEGRCWLYRDRNADPFLDRHRDHVCRLRRFEDSADPYRALQTAWLLGEWSRGVGYAQLCGPFRNMREGYIRTSADCGYWLLDAAAAMSRINVLEIDPLVSRFLFLLGKRLLFGVSEEGLALMEVVRNRTALGVALSGVGRSKVQEFVSAGLDDLNKIVEADDGDLLRIVRNQDQVTSLREAIVRYLERTSGSLLARHTQRSKKFSRDTLVRRVYESLGTEFEVAVHDLLRAISIDVRLLDEKKVPGCSDLVIPTSRGNVQVECKTKKAGKGQVTNTEAFEVMGKTHVGGRPIAYATVGKPSFVEAAIKNSFTKGVTLVTHQTVCEVAIQVMEGQKAQADIEKLFLSGRYVETAELR